MDFETCFNTSPVILKEALSHSFNRTKLVKERFRGIQANSSPLSPEELDDSQELKSSGCVSLACDMMELYNVLDPKIFGGCCGTDSTHIEEIAKRLKVYKQKGIRKDIK